MSPEIHKNRSRRVRPRACASRWLVPLTGTVLLWAAGGCGDRGEKFFRVAGSVKLDGKPLTVGAVSLRPDSSRGNGSKHIPTGAIDRQGNYELVTIGKNGAPPGWYKVLVFADANTLPTGVAAHPLPPKWLMNVKYTDPATTDLAVEVSESPTAGAYDLNLTK